VPSLEGDPDATNPEKWFIPGKSRAGASSLNGFMDVTEDTGWDVREVGISGALHYVARMPQGTAAGSWAIETRERDTGDSRAFDQGGIALLNWTGGGTGAWIGHAYVMTAGEEEMDAEAAYGASEDSGETIAGETYALVLRVTAVEGSGSATFKVEQSDDDDDVDPYAQMTGLSIAVTGGATAGTNDVTFTGPGVAWITKAGVTKLWKRLVISDLTDFDSVTAIATHGNATVE
jgi:hypothetical protein